MEPVIRFEGVSVFHGDCREVLATLPDNSVDSVVTDPPYELGFMGKRWDSTGIAYDVDVWSECLRVLKPGGHVLAFGGSRTWHRLAVAIEDAGFQLRDSIAWLYSTGFPKSLDVSKAIDKNNGEGGRKLKFTRWMRTTGLKVSDATRVLREARLISENGTMAGHFFAESNAGQPAIPTAELWAVLRPHCGDVPGWVDELVARVEAEREVIGQKMSGIADKNEKGRHTIGASKAVEVDITAPSTPEAQKWQGWGTALKPAFEPVVVGRKPLVGTVAENVLQWGVGGLNIDGSRIASPDNDGKVFVRGGNQKGHSLTTNTSGENEYIPANPLGRWPANVILDEVSAGLLDEQSGVSVSKSGGKAGPIGFHAGGSGAERGGHEDSGGASRFFYVAKASKRDRNEGLNLCRCDKLDAWENEDHKAQRQAVTDQSTEKAIGESGTLNKNDSEWNTSSSGNKHTVPSKTGSKSTTKMATNSTIASTTLSLLIQSPTSDSTAGVNSERANGGNRAKSVANISQSASSTGISAEKAGPNMADADPATSKSLSSQNSVGAHQCPKCFGIIGGHPTVKPTTLMRYLVKLVTPPGGTVLDPFTGSGSTGKAAILEGFEFVGVELTEDYLPIIEGRLKWALDNREDGTLF